MLAVEYNHQSPVGQMVAYSLLGMVSGYFTFSSKFFSEQEQECQVKVSSNKLILAKSASIEVNINRKYKMGFAVVFYLYMALLVLGALSWISRQIQVRKLFSMVMGGLQWLVMFVWIWLLYWRFSPAGVYCASQFEG